MHRQLLNITAVLFKCQFLQEELHSFLDVGFAFEYEELVRSHHHLITYGLGF